MDVDYDVYAQGEADLGWLNAQVRATGDEPFNLDRFLLSLVDSLKGAFQEADAETAHLKTIGMHEGHYAVANLISSIDPIQLSLASNCMTKTADIVVNARVAIDPEILTAEVRRAIETVSTNYRVNAEITSLQSFKPGRPVPTHRLNPVED
jgi:hypothetical protein